MVTVMLDRGIRVGVGQQTESVVMIGVGVSRVRMAGCGESVTVVGVMLSRGKGCRLPTDICPGWGRMCVGKLGESVVVRCVVFNWGVCPGMDVACQRKPVVVIGVVV